MRAKLSSSEDWSKVDFFGGGILIVDRSTSRWEFFTGRDPTK